MSKGWWWLGKSKRSSALNTPLPKGSAGARSPGPLFERLLDGRVTEKIFSFSSSNHLLGLGIGVALGTGMVIRRLFHRRHGIFPLGAAEMSVPLAGTSHHMPLGNLL